MSTRTIAGAIATAAALVLGAGGIVAFGSTAQAEPTMTPGPGPKSVTVCVTGPDGTAFKGNRVIARSFDPGHYRLRSVTQTAAVAGGCGVVVVGSTGTVQIRAEHISKKRVRKHICVRTVYRAQWPAMNASTIVDGSTVSGKLRQVSKTIGRC